MRSDQGFQYFVPGWIRDFFAKMPNRRNPISTSLACIFIASLVVGIASGSEHDPSAPKACQIEACIQIRTIPPFSFVFIDSAPVGQLPKPAFVVPTGRHHIQIQRNSVHFDTSIDLIHGFKKVNITLFGKDSAVLGTRNKGKGENPVCQCRPAPAPVDSSQIQLDSVFFKKSMQRTAVLSIQTNLGSADVIVDGSPLGTTPFEGIKFIPGAHRVILKYGGRTKMDTTILLNRGSNGTRLHHSK